MQEPSLSVSSSRSPSAPMSASAAEPRPAPYADNPLRAGLRLRRSPEPSTVVIFGVTGDLSNRKLLPSLFRLYAEGRLPVGAAVIGVARRDWDDEVFRREVRAGLDEFLGEPVREEIWRGFAATLHFSPGTFDDPATYTRLADRLADVDGTFVHTGNRVFYLAAPPSAYLQVIDGLGAAGLGGRAAGPGWARIIVEKPFGRDLASARGLNERLRTWFHEQDIYRIDHYLGKETVQNILVLRLANGIFEPVWNRQYVDHVQITVAEDLGVAGRGAYYQEAGAIRDMIQNHVLQLLALVAMEPPASFAPTAVRDERVKVLSSLRPLEGHEVDRAVVRGQYDAGLVHGERVVSYRSEEGVDPGSSTETFVAMRVFVDTWRWAGVPFYLRTGKRLPKRVSEIAIQFRRPPLLLFGHEGAGLEPNVLALHIQPEEGATLRVGSKVPGPAIRVHPVYMDFRYGTAFGQRSAEAYERLLLDCLLGDSTLFTRDDGVEAAWRFVDGIVTRWRDAPVSGPARYEAGSWGPEAAETLIERDGREWRRL